MRHGRFVYVLGDIHGEFGALNAFINKEIRQNRTLRTIAPYWKADNDDLQAVILQCGDFAWFWPQYESQPVIRNEISFLPGGRIPIYWTGGNHEDWDALDNLFQAGSGNIVEVAPGVHYCRLGATLELAPDITVLFAGGAESADKKERLELMATGYPKIWWPQEGISDADMERLANVPRADWVISHTAPNAFDIEAKMRGVWGGFRHMYEPSRGRLEEILVRYRPRMWFFGHFHHNMSGRTDGCDWECLNYLGSGGRWWNKLYLEWQDEKSWQNHDV